MHLRALPAAQVGGSAGGYPGTNPGAGAGAGAGAGPSLDGRALVLAEMATAYVGLGDRDTAHALVWAAVKTSPAYTFAMADFNGFMSRPGASLGDPLLLTDGLVGLVTRAAKVASVMHGLVAELGGNKNRTGTTGVTAVGATVDPRLASPEAEGVSVGTSVGKSVGESDDRGLAIPPPDMCSPYRTFADLFKGQLAPALRAIPPLPFPCGGDQEAEEAEAEGGDGGLAYRAVTNVLLGPSGVGHPDKAWRELSYYALANLEHSYVAERWDPLAFPERLNASQEAIANRPLSDTTDTIGMAARAEGDANALRWLTDAVPNLKNRTRLELAIQRMQYGVDGVGSDGGHRFRNGRARARGGSSGVVVVTVATAEVEALTCLRQSASSAGVELVVLGLELALEPSEYGHFWKIRLLKEYLEGLQRERTAKAKDGRGNAILLKYESPTKPRGLTKPINYRHPCNNRGGGGG